VTALDFSFSPAELDASAGLPLTVQLENAGAFPHTLTVYEDAAFATPVAGADTGNVSAGDSGEFTATFTEAREYFFRCEIHNQMQGTLTVE
jgi:plastocyanin